MENALKDWRMRRQTPMHGSDVDKYRFEVLKRSFDQNILARIKDNPEIRFYIFYPPYSILTWVDVSEKGFLDDALEFSGYVFEATRHMGNVRIYNLQDAEEMTFDLDNYKDVNHYSQKINEFIIDSIATDAYLMTDENAESHIKRLRDQVREFKSRL